MSAVAPRPRHYRKPETNTVAGLGAPVVDTADLIAAWDTLTRWAAAERTTRSAQLPALREAAADAATAVATAGAEHTQAAAGHTRLRDKQNTAATDLARLTQTRDQTAARQQNLSAALTEQTRRRPGCRTHRRTRPPRPGCWRGA